MPTRLTHAQRAQRRAEIAAYAAEGNSMGRCVKRFKLSSATIAAACIEHGVAPPANMPARQRAWAFCRILTMAIQKVPRQTIARELGVSSAHVYRTILNAKRLGLFDAIEYATGKKLDYVYN